MRFNVSGCSQSANTPDNEHKLTARLAAIALAIVIKGRSTSNQFKLGFFSVKFSVRAVDKTGYLVGQKMRCGVN
jgi:hypothetical protein